MEKKILPGKLPEQDALYKRVKIIYVVKYRG